MKKLIRLIIGNLVVLACILSVLAVGTELVARTQPRSSFLSFHPKLGFTLTPNTEGHYRGFSYLNPNPRIQTDIRINSLGIRGPERSLARQPDTFRVVALGDSFVQAFEVPYEQSFYGYSEARAEQVGAKLEIIPMGVMGYGQAQELLWFQELGTRFQPDVVVLFLFFGNDISDNSREILFSRGRPYFELRDGKVVLTTLPGGPSRFKYWASEYLRSYPLYKDLGSRIKPLLQLSNRLGLANNQAGNADTENSEERVKKVRRGYDLTFALIDELRRVTSLDGTHFVLVYHGNAPSGSGVDSEGLTRQFCQRTQLDCLNLNPLLKKAEENFIPDDGHWSPAGHQLVADALWDYWFSQ